MLHAAGVASLVSETPSDGGRVGFVSRPSGDTLLIMSSPQDPRLTPDPAHPAEPGPVRGGDTRVAQPAPGSAATGDRPAKGGEVTPNMLPGRERRKLGLERLVTRIIATSGVIGIGVALGAILASSKTQGWIIGLVVAIVSVILSAILWSSRQL
jgi:tetrahydromethanopterin S-methyltransferase subunit F